MSFSSGEYTIYTLTYNSRCLSYSYERAKLQQFINFRHELFSINEFYFDLTVFCAFFEFFKKKIFLLYSAENFKKY